MGYVTGIDRQTALGGPEDEIPQDSFDLEAMDFERAIPAPTGRPPYHPGVSGGNVPATPTWPTAQADANIVIFCFYFVRNVL